MWHYIVTLPWAAKTITLLIVGVGTVWAWLKHRTIAGVSSAATKAAESRFFGWFGKKLYAASPPPITTGKPNNERTYRGVFQSCLQYANPPAEHFFTLEDRGSTIKVPIVRTNLLSGVQRGEFVEIDTRVGIYHGTEVVQRVRVINSENPRGPFAKGDAGY